MAKDFLPPIDPALKRRALAGELGQDAQTINELRDEIARLRAALAAAQAGAPKRPVAWRVKDYADGWVVFQDERAAYAMHEETGALMQGLYVRDGTPFPAPAGAPSEEDVMRMADAIDLARYQHPETPRERPRPFSEADRSDREYATRLARAAYMALLQRGEK